MIRSCSTFNEAFAQAGSLIASHVLTEQIEPHLQPEAIAVFGSSRIKAWNQATFSAFDRRHLQRRNCRRVTWSLEDIKSISRLRRRINYFADDFAAKSKSHMLGGSASVTVTERARFQRAFYMFELFCNVFQDFRRPVLPLPETSTQFFARFSIVENEQLACVHDYLFRAIVPAFDDMVEHDVVWGEMSVEYSDWRDPGYIEPLLARGIEGVYSIVTAEGYEESYESMYPRYPETTHNFLNAALNGSNEDYHNVPIWSYASQDINEANAHSFFEETDEGPAEVWLWPHRRFSKRLFVNSDAHRSLQQWGYVMWDLPELNKADVFKSAWRQPPPEQASIL
ncbi:hypothetical protein BKA61DRAFT_472119 [Leptodontidium sp. MPI-SDFR-AT-0119]|nr:hypothetical protein BKA61DRAFT_472119 [Leptodontidium sp. MPI-SDFR-AT-0119]